ncbi:MAG: dockerin type I domain-containing protein, partial [Pirellulales bacterium]|nr:dockerin type I domain-containing protein [Pirellulales bacterium]
SGDAADFVFDPGSGELSVAAGATLDFETQPTKTLQFQIRDPSGSDATAVRTLTIGLTDQNDPPTLITELLIVSELATAGTPVGRVEVQVREEDALDTVSVEIVGGSAAELFDLDAQSRILTVADGAQFDADTAGPALTIDVKVTDAGGLFSVGTITINLNDVNEPPDFRGNTLAPIPLVSGQPLELILPPDFVVDPEGLDFELAVFDSTGLLPDWMDFDEASRTLSGLPGPLEVGTYALTLRAFEAGPLELFDELHFDVVVSQGETPLTSQRNPLDVDGNGIVSPLDALLVINFMGRFGVGASVLNFLDEFNGFVDVSGDGSVTAIDALQVINGIEVLNPFEGLAGESVQAIDTDDREESNDVALLELISEAKLF